ncbi:Lrp/AsnC family transcriptional regulator [Papillibacter cinnamivorans]|uniref:Lrp/AsnC family transcriptional regulator, leucine-responsive regulatory protein n=1 Tax=Papillibacter cinnamivorans DSM 12816 TaxID=1122930 RepID=A0A1W2BFS0_9FIRM|nr:Lrp/AsnC family transcriptional regulator [Papillibacter cinnamivorans]SMC71664.1 Lrp/AsnC family transcriptional regulator, leucine-responsive regulatory protein [Papillibacter cinnamivorans DSM 12816]
MDSIDYKILNILQKNSRQKASAISPEVNLSVSAVIERIRKMEREGILQKYTIKVDHKRLGYDLTAFVGVTLELPIYYDNFIQVTREMSSVLFCNYVTGEFDFILKVMATATEELEKIHHEIMKIKGVLSIKTFFVLSNCKDDVQIPEDSFLNFDH